MANNSELEFRQFSLSDTESLKETFRLCFETEVNKKYFQWKYVDNPMGEVVAFVATDGNTIAAFYGVLPELYTVNGETVKVYQSMDTMTHPNYQRRGLFGTLAKMTYKHVLDTEGALKLVGIPGTSSYPGFVKKLEWKDINQFKYLFANRLFFKTAYIFNRGKKIEGKLIKEMNVELAEFLNNRKISHSPIQPLLTSEFFNWRVFQNPLKDFQVLQIKNEGKTVGVCVYTMVEKNRCFINFLSFNDEKSFSEHAGSAIDLLFNETRAQTVYTWTPPNKTLNSAYKKLGFLTNPFDKGPFSYRVPLIIRAEPGETDGVNWYDINDFDVQPLMQD